MCRVDSKSINENDFVINTIKTVIHIEAKESKQDFRLLFFYLFSLLHKNK